MDVDQAGRFHDALGDNVALHDAAEDIHEDGVDLWVLAQNFERSPHLGCRGAATNVEEVGRFATFQLNYVHRGHRQASPIDHAADVAVKRDIVEAHGGRFGLVSVCVRAGIARLMLRHDRFLAEVSILVDINLRINAVYIEVRGDSPGVDLDLRGVHLDEHVVQFL